VLFFGAAASRLQIGGVNQSDRWSHRVHTLQQRIQEQFVNLAGTAHADSLAKLMQHANARQPLTMWQVSKLAPRPLLAEQADQQVQRVHWSQQRQQMHSPQLRRTESVTAASGRRLRPVVLQILIRNEGREQPKQLLGSCGRQD